MQYSDAIRLESASRHEDLKNSLLCPAIIYTTRIISSSHIREKRRSQISHWGWLTKYLAFRLGLIVYGEQDRNAVNFFLRCALQLPLGMSKVLTAQILLQNWFPSCPRLRLSPQGVIPGDSEIIQACQDGDVSKIRGILLAHGAHPNDRTADGLTVFRVSSQAF